MDGVTFGNLKDPPQTVFIVDADDIKLTGEQNAVVHSQDETILAYLSIGEVKSFRSNGQSN